MQHIKTVSFLFFPVNAAVVTLIDESIDVSIVNCVHDKGAGQGDAH